MSRSLTPVVCALALLAVAAVASGSAIGQPTVADRDSAADATVVVASDSVVEGATARVPVTLSSAPGGVAGYNVTISVADPNAATVVGASVPDRYGLSETRVVDGGAAVVLRAADTNDDVTTGAEAVPLATVTVRGDTPDETELRVEIDVIDDDDGDRLDAGTDAGSFVVEERVTGTSTTTTTTTAPTTAPPTTTTIRTTSPPPTTTTASTTAPPTTTTASTTAPPTTTTTRTTTPLPTTTASTTAPPTTEASDSTTAAGTAPDGTEPGESTATPTAADTDGSETDDGGTGTPGPGPIGTIVAMLGGLELARRRRRSEDGN